MNDRVSWSETECGESGGAASIWSAYRPSSSSASGLPAVARCSRTSCSGRTGPFVSATSSAVASRSSPGTSAVGSEAQTAAPGAPARTVTKTATASEISRRAAKTSASAEELSSRCASSTSTASGRSSAARQSRLRVAAPTANRLGSVSSAEPSSKADARALAWAWGIWSSSGSTGLSSWSRPAKGTNCSDSTPWACNTRMSATMVCASARSAVLPMPGSPLSTSTRLSPTRAPARSVPMVRRSDSRPTSTSRSLGAAHADAVAPQ